MKSEGSIFEIKGKIKKNMMADDGGLKIHN